MAEVLVEDGSQPAAVQHLLSRPDVAYVLVRDKNAGCFDFRVERLPGGNQPAELVGI